MATMKGHAQRVSYADLETWPDDGRRYELYDGDVFVVPPPLPVHQIAAARLHLLLHEYFHQSGAIVLFAPLDIVLTEYDVVQPDLIVFAPQRAHLVKAKEATREPPDLAVEILSPTTVRNDRGRKMQLLARHAAKEYWLFDPEVPRLEVYGLVHHGFEIAFAADGGDVAQSRLFPGLHVRPAELVSRR